MNTGLSPIRFAAQLKIKHHGQDDRPEERRFTKAVEQAFENSPTWKLLGSDTLTPGIIVQVEKQEPVKLEAGDPFGINHPRRKIGCDPYRYGDDYTVRVYNESSDGSQPLDVFKVSAEKVDLPLSRWGQPLNNTYEEQNIERPPVLKEIIGRVAIALSTTIHNRAEAENKTLALVPQ